MLSRKYLKAWFASLVVCAGLVVLCLRWFDLPVAQIFRHNPGRVQAYGLPSAIILAGELAVICIIAAVRMVRGRLPDSAKTLMIALLTSVTTFTANNYVLKIVFGVPQVFDVIFLGARHGPHFLAGSQSSGFPSGHMALAGGFAGVWLRLYPRTAPVFAGLLAVGMALLVAGDWHFLSDVVAGTFVGVTAGLMAGTLWLEHNTRRPD
jgi:membrane-associated phospholipid phosphatase